MAKFDGSTGFGSVDMGNIPYFTGTSSSVSSTKLSVWDYTNQQDYYGAFSISPQGAITGTITSTYYKSSYGPTYSLTGISFNAETAFTLIDSRRVDDLVSILLNGSDSITGTSKNDVLYGYAGNDQLYPKDGSDTVDGGAGVDTVFIASTKAKATLAKTLTGWKVTSNYGFDVDTLQNVERVWFDDVAIALDTSGNAGQAYRLYQAALGRTPDKGGLGYHINSLDSGYSLVDVAKGFIGSPEFSGKYGALSNGQFVEQLYQNVLHRSADSGGLTYHVANLDGGMSRAQVLVGFSESPENQAALIGVIQNGMEYVPV